jgi:hypothetical protein
VERFTGVARGPGGAVVYLEEHEVRRDGGRLVEATTVYRDPGGRRIAVLRTDFSTDPFAPSYEFEDLRTGEAEAVRVAAGEVALRAGERARTLGRDPAAPRLVTGQGLDRLVRERLPEIAAGETLRLAYAIPSRLGAYDLRVRSVGDPDGATVRVRVEFSSWVLRLLAPALDVEYDRTTRRLVRYRGVSNLEDASGANPEVEITYAYPQEREDPRGTS